MYYHIKRCIVHNVVINIVYLFQDLFVFTHLHLEELLAVCNPHEINKELNYR